MNARPAPRSRFSRWIPGAAAVGLLGAVVAFGIISGNSSDTDGTPDAVTASSGPPASYQAVEESEEQVVKVPLGGPVGAGSVGGDVQMVQARLAALGFDPGPVDGQFGTLTTQAVWAFEKLILGTPRAEATGIVTPTMWDRMQDPITVTPRRPTGGAADHTEIYLPEQVMVVFHADAPVLVAHVSTGELAPGATAFTPWYETADEYCETVTIDTNDRGELLDEPVEKAICGRSYTPPGVFEAYKMIEGRRESRLGGMYDPIYINQGIAIHGANEIPLYPASHGCIRVSRPLGERLQSIIDIGDAVLIWDGVTEPEDQSAEAMQMRFDYPDPNATTTTSTTTTTTTTTTTLPPTTTAPAPPVPPTTAVPPTATTTTAAPLADT